MNFQYAWKRVSWVRLSRIRRWVRLGGSDCGWLSVCCFLGYRWADSCCFCSSGCSGWGNPSCWRHTFHRDVQISDPIFTLWSPYWPVSLVFMASSLRLHTHSPSWDVRSLRKIAIFKHIRRSWCFAVNWLRSILFWGSEAAISLRSKDWCFMDWD